MASNYPGSLDSFDTIASDKKTSDSVGGRTHRQMHNDLGDAIEAVQAELGTTPSGSYDTVKARFEAIEGSTLPQIDAKGDLIVGTADNTYDNLAAGTNDTVLVADSGQAKGVKWAQVPTAGIADNAVTSAKIADGTIATADLADAAVTAAKLAVQPGNLLTANQAKPTTTGGYPTLNGCTEGTAGVFTASDTNPFSARTSDIPVTAGEVVTALLTLTTVGRTATVLLDFRDGGGSNVGGFPTGNVIASGSSGESRLTTIAPATSVNVRVTIYTGSGSAGNTVTLANASFHRGAGGTWQAPGVPPVGQSRIAVNGAVDLSGTGTPEGVITAAPGSTWLQTDSTTDVKGWLKWVKATGTGNTGWVAGPEADTGWRNVSSLLVNSWTGTSVLLRRVGDAVSFRATLNGTTASAVTALNLPVGFRPKSLFQVPVPRAATLSDSIVAEFVATDGAVVLWSGNGKGASQYVVGEFMTPANQSWPSSLPGTAA